MPVQPTVVQIALPGKAGSSRVSMPADVPERPEVVVECPEADRAAAGVDAGAEDVGEDPLGAALDLDALIADLVARILAVPDRQARRDARQRPGLEQALELQRGAARAAPRQRHRQAFVDAEEIHRADPSAVGEAVAVGVADDRQEHQLAAQPPDRSRDRVRHARDVDPADRRAHARLFVDDEDQGDVGGAVEGAIALADVDGLELAAVLEAAGDRLDAVGGQRLPDGDAGEVGDLLVRQEGVAVNADFADDLILGIAGV